MESCAARPAASGSKISSKSVPAEEACELQGEIASDGRGRCRARGRGAAGGRGGGAAGARLCAQDAGEEGGASHALGGVAQQGEVRVLEDCLKFRVRKVFLSVLVF